MFKSASPKSELTDLQLSAAFNELSLLFKGDKEAALTVIRKQPEIFLPLCRSPAPSTKTAQEVFSTGSAGVTASIQSVKECFATYEAKFGFDKALGLATRNPSLLCIRPTGGYTARLVLS